MSKFLMGREESLLLSPIHKLALWRRARENLQGIARDQLLEIPPLPQVKKPKWYRGKSIVSDGPPPPPVQPPEEEEFFPTPFPHIPVRGSGNWSLQISGFFQYCGGDWNFSSRVDLHCHQFLWTCQCRGTQTGISCFKKGSHSSAERCCRISEPSSYSRFLFPAFSSTKEKWENETCDRPLRPGSASNSAAFQDGDQQIYQGFNSFRYVDNVSPQVPEICLGRQGIRFQDDAFWPIYSPSSIYQNCPGSGSTFIQPVNFHPFLFARFTVEKYVPISSERSYPFCDRFAPQTGFPNFMEEVGAST